MRALARIRAGSVLLPALLLFMLTGCGVEADRFDAGEVERAGKFEVSMNVKPNPPESGGPTELTFMVRKNGKPFEGASRAPRLTADMPDMPMGASETSLKRAGPGRWRAEAEFRMAGEWVATLELPSDDEATFEFEVAP